MRNSESGITTSYARIVNEAKRPWWPLVAPTRMGRMDGMDRMDRWAGLKWMGWDGIGREARDGGANNPSYMPSNP
jgi:hypothetical protein